MSRVTIVFFALVLVLLFSNFSSEARHVPDAVTSTITTASNKDVAEESCAGVGKEECLMRRTLVAHLDYIYTQEKNP
ncbi:phytosulfokine [Artemisia annua]|uniref:Phytosulfokine n=1 Tax=Artemisia annua TaxID=35608 RepID=A0A2U1KLJ0_ARTAN|nr:phytosulfokine [Artemisia annua]